jgi:hypothetical protein
MNRRIRFAAVALAMVLAVIMVHGAVASIRAAATRVVDIERFPVIVLDAGHPSAINTNSHLSLITPFYRQYHILYLRKQMW